MISVACVYKSGGDDTLDYVKRLRASVRRQWPERLRFFCLTDLVDEVAHANIAVLPLRHDLPGRWSKMELFRPEVREHLQDTLFLDLDTLIVGALDGIANRMGAFIVLRDFARPLGWDTGLMHIPAMFGTGIWEAFIADAQRNMALLPGVSDFLVRHAGKAAHWQDVLPGQVVSYHAHECEMGPPPGARLVCFKGSPRPHKLKGWVSKAWRRPDRLEPQALVA